MQSLKYYEFKNFKFNRYPENSGELVPFYTQNFEKMNFKVKRFFFYLEKKIYQSDHVHLKCSQIIIPINGKLKLLLIERIEKNIHFKSI